MFVNALLHEPIIRENKQRELIGKSRKSSWQISIQFKVIFSWSISGREFASLLKPELAFEDVENLALLSHFRHVVGVVIKLDDCSLMQSNNNAGSNEWFLTGQVKIKYLLTPYQLGNNIVRKR